MTKVQPKLKIMTAEGGESSDSDVEILGEHLVTPKEIVLDRKESEDILKMLKLNKKLNIPKGSVIRQVRTVGKPSSLQPTLCKVIMNGATVSQNILPAGTIRHPSFDDVLPLSSSSDSEEEDIIVVRKVANSQTSTRKNIPPVMGTCSGVKHDSGPRPNVTSRLLPSHGSLLLPPSSRGRRRLLHSTPRPDRPSLKPQTPVLRSESLSLLPPSSSQQSPSSDLKTQRPSQSSSLRRHSSSQRVQDEEQRTNTCGNTGQACQVIDMSLTPSREQPSSLFAMENVITPKQPSTTSLKHSTPATRLTDSLSTPATRLTDRLAPCFNQECSTIIPASRDGLDEHSNPETGDASYAQTGARQETTVLELETEKTPANTFSKTPANTLSKIPANTVIKTPAHTLIKSPAHAVGRTPGPAKFPQTYNCSLGPLDPPTVLNRSTQTSPIKLPELSLHHEGSPRLPSVSSSITSSHPIEPLISDSTNKSPSTSIIQVQCPSIPSTTVQSSSTSNTAVQSSLFGTTVQSSDPSDTALCSTIPAETRLPSSISGLQTDDDASNPHHNLQWIEGAAGQLFLPVQQLIMLLSSPCSPDQLIHCQLPEGVLWDGWTVIGLSLVNVIALLRMSGDEKGVLEALEVEEQLRRLESENPPDTFPGELTKEYFMSTLDLCHTSHVDKIVAESHRKRESMRGRKTRRRPAAQRDGAVKKKKAKKMSKVKQRK